MEKNIAETKAKECIKKVVNLISEKQYEKLESAAELESLSAADIKELVEGYLDLNELTHIDSYGADCNFHPQYEYQQLNFYHYNNGSGFHADYDLTTDGELNDLTLQMEFLYDKEKDNGLKAKILDLHVM